MLRAAVLSIVLSFAAGPSAAAWCQVLCDQPMVASSACHHQAPVTDASLTCAHCSNAMLSTPAVIRDDVSRVVTHVGIRDAVPFARSPFISTDRPATFESHDVRLEHRPLVTVLRA